MHINEELAGKFELLFNIPNCKDNNYRRAVVSKELSIQIIKEQENKCFLCSSKSGNPIIHHIIPDGVSERSNLIMLCPLCHRWVHWILKKFLGYKASQDFYKL